jgi:hypothetical protein
MVGLAHVRGLMDGLTQFYAHVATAGKTARALPAAAVPRVIERRVCWYLHREALEAFASTAIESTAAFPASPTVVERRIRWQLERVVE